MSTRSDDDWQETSPLIGDGASDRAPSPAIYSISSVSSFSSEENESVRSEPDRPSVALAEASPVSPQKHEKYYFEDANVQLSVDNVLYNVPRIVLTRPSAWFRARFSQPVDCLPPDWITHTTARGEVLYVNHSLGLVQDERPEQSSTPDVYRLYGASSFEFDALLLVLCSDDNDELDLGKEEWSAVLKLATLWTFPSIQELAMQRLESLLANEEPLDCLVYARKLGLDDLAIVAIQELIEREEPLEEDEAAQLTHVDVVRIAKGREQAFHTLLDNQLRHMRTEMDELRERMEAEAAERAVLDVVDSSEAAPKSSHEEGHRDSFEAEPALDEATTAVSEKDDAYYAAMHGNEVGSPEEGRAYRELMEVVHRRQKEREEAQARRVAESAQDWARRFEARRWQTRDTRLDLEEAREAQTEPAAATPIVAEGDRLLATGKDAARLDRDASIERKVGEEIAHTVARRLEEERLTMERDAVNERTGLATPTGTTEDFAKRLRQEDAGDREQQTMQELERELDALRLGQLEQRGRLEQRLKADEALRKALCDTQQRNGVVPPSSLIDHPAPNSPIHPNNPFSSYLDLFASPAQSSLPGPSTINTHLTVPSFTHFEERFPTIDSGTDVHEEGYSRARGSGRFGVEADWSDWLKHDEFGRM